MKIKLLVSIILMELMYSSTGLFFRPNALQNDQNKRGSNEKNFLKIYLNFLFLFS